jgi:CIC family chloride channel protein
MISTPRDGNRFLFICVLSCIIAYFSVFIAKVLLMAITLTTNIFYFQKFSFQEAVASENTLGWWAILVPIVGGLIVGIMARFGSKAIRGHGIPEAMENILTKESRIPKRITILKPVSSAIAIGTGGPFGAEGPIIATGSSLGSLMGQIIPVSAMERKILVASGAAAGMTAIFGTPFSAVLLAIELLLFEFRGKSFIPVAFASAMAATLRYIFFDQKPFFIMPDISAPNVSMLLIYILFGVVVGFLSVVVTKTVYWVEDLFEKIPIHWMYWPAIAGIFVGVIGVIEPRTLAVGYNNITDALSGNFIFTAALSLMIFKFLSWTIALSSGTSGGTLAPLMTIGGCFGFLFGKALLMMFPEMPIDIHTMALIGMAGIFAGASRAVLTSVIFALEATRQPVGLVPLLSCCAIAYVISILFMENSIMTEKIVRRGIHVPHEYYPKS